MGKLGLQIGENTGNHLNKLIKPVVEEPDFMAPAQLKNTNDTFLREDIMFGSAKPVREEKLVEKTPKQ
jgi:hypothetical protein